MIPESLPPTLCNLMRTFEYYKEQLEMVPMPPKELTQNTRIQGELLSTLRTILRV